MAGAGEQRRLWAGTESRQQDLGMPFPGARKESRRAQSAPPRPEFREETLILLLTWTLEVITQKAVAHMRPRSSHSLSEVGFTHAHDGLWGG